MSVKRVKQKKGVVENVFRHKRKLVAAFLEN